MSTITCKIPETLNAELGLVAETLGVSKSEVVRDAIERKIEQQKQQQGLSAHDVMNSACGVIKQGPSDRSWNPKRMKGFGRD
jgi:metal-responsive CopG/Arc/MetJ family transcriptional regulator